MATARVCFRLAAALAVATAALVPLGAAMTIRKEQPLLKPAHICDRTADHCCYYQNVTELDSTASSEILEAIRAPIVIFSPGCSGSTAVMTMVRDLAALGEQPVLDCDGGYELLNDISSGYYGEENRNLLGGVRDFVQRATYRNRRLLFKAEARFAEQDPELMKYLLSVKSKIINFQRWNKLDLAICTIKDCFSEMIAVPPFGYEVDEDGNMLGECNFRGRGTNETTVDSKVHVNVSYVVANLRRLVEVRSWTREFLTEQGAPFQQASYEDLFAFNTGDSKDLNLSVEAWSGMMAALDIKVSALAIKTYLLGQTGVHAPPKKHSQVIENFDQIKNAIKICAESDPTCSHLMNMIRE